MARGLLSLQTQHSVEAVPVDAVNVIQPGASPAGPATGGFSLFGADGPSFRDVLDIINPLHHIPVVGNLYRKITGDVIAPAIRVAGGALFGGPLGAAFAAASVVMQAVVGDDVESATSTAPAPVRAVPQTAPGGWMVATTRSFDRVSEPPAENIAQVAARAAPTTRRGGWMVQAAYAMADARSAERERAGIDTLA